MSKIIKPGDRAFYINRKRYVETESHACVGVAGFFMGQAIKPGYGVVREFGFKVPNKNLITDLGLDAIGSSDAAFDRMHLGTGTGTPSFTDVALGAFGVSVANSAPSLTIGAQASAPYFGWRRSQWTSAVGGATGNWTEIGVSSTNTTGNLRSRALIVDGGGSPIAFTVQPDEQFRGTYELRFYSPTSDSLDAITLTGVAYDTTTRAIGVQFDSFWAPGSGNISYFAAVSAANIGAWNGGLVAVTGNDPAGTYLGAAGSSGAAAYTNGNHYRDAFARWGSGQGVGSIRTLRFRYASAAFQIEYTPTITKLTTEEFIHNQRVSWARI